ncbi:MAG: SAM-dependent methyltransferase [Paludibacteraceae bacterium]|nr:SAM-dependent methyltransferase [Paludibacteraceae bacterium]
MFNIPDLSSLLSQHQHYDVQQLALQRNRFPQLSDADFRFFLQQVEGKQRTRDKLPTLNHLPDWWFPVRLSCEQCSSEATAGYKAKIYPSDCHTLIDLTAGYGVDTFFMSENATEAHYVERNAELCAIAEHNFSLYRPKIQVHNTTAEEFLTTLPISNSQYPISDTPYPISYTLIYLDPARRSQSGGKVFRIEDCEPNVIELLPTLRQHASHIMIKFSPMLDITAALRVLGKDWDTHIVAVNNEVKEVLFLTGTGVMHAVNIRGMRTDRFLFIPEDEKQAQLTIATDIQQYIYEPNAAIIKAGAFRWIGERYELQKLDTNTHLYTSDTFMSDFPGRIWEVVEAEVKDPKKQLDSRAKYSILSRNYPLSPEEIRKKYKLKDGDDRYLLAARHQGKPRLILAHRLTNESQ